MRLVKLFTHDERGAWLILALTVIAGFVVRLYKIDNPVADWHSWRQADTASVTRIYRDEGLNLLYPKYYDISSVQSGIFNPKALRYVEFPIFNVAHLWLYKVGSRLPSAPYNWVHAYLSPAMVAPSVVQRPAAFVDYVLWVVFGVKSLETWGRLLSVFSALVSTVFLYLIGKRFMGKWGGLAAAAFYAFLPFNIYFTRVILPEPMAVAFALAAVWFFIRYTDTDSYTSLYVSALLFACSALIKPFTFFYLLPLVYLAWQKYGGIRPILRDYKFLIAFDLALAPFFLWRIWINHYPAAIPHFEWAFNGDGIRFRPAFWRWIFGERLGRLILGIWGLVPFTVGLLVTRKRNLFVGLFFVGMLAYLTVFATASVRHDYYQTFVIPAVALVLAQGVLFLWNPGSFNKWLSRGILLFSVILMLGMSAYQVKEFFKINHPEIIVAGEAVDRLTPKDALVIAPYTGDTAFLYHTGRYGWPVVEDSFENLIQKGADYYVSVNLDDADTRKLLKEYKTVEKTDRYVLIDLHSPLK